MASRVFSGNSNFSWTNDTGQNVRVVINYARASSTSISMGWGATATATSTSIQAFGRNLAFTAGGGTATSIASNNAVPVTSNEAIESALPTEIMLANGEAFSITGISSYNIVVIPEAG